MIVIAQRHGVLGEARALRFLLLLFGGWALVRMVVHWNPAVPPPPAPAIAPAAWGHEAASAPWTSVNAADFVGHATAPTVPASRRLPLPPPETPDARAVGGGGGWAKGGRHHLRLALMARMLPSFPGHMAQTAFPAGRASWMTAPTSDRNGPPGGGKPFWMQRQLTGWSLGGWVYLRDGSGRTAEGIAAASQLGGSQAGTRIAFGLGDTGRLRAYGRATIALAAPRQRDVALGLAFAPVARWPVDVAVEQRIAAGSDGRTALAAMVVGGFGDVALPHAFRLEAYGQAGVVGARRRDAFVDAALVIDREVARMPTASLHLGGLAAGAAQPGAARVDVGPRLTLRLPKIGEGSRVALDWRQRVAGDAEPESGLALTLAADF